MNINAVGFDFSKFVPGFDFLKQITQPRSMMPSPAQWVAPTVDPEEVERRIQELRTVQFWLEQNTTALKATIQALEVQKMTLTTLKDMNVSMNDMAQVFQQGMADTVSSVTQAVKAAVPEAPAEPAPASTVTWHEVPVQPAATAAGAETPAQEEESPLNAAFAQAGQWWGSMMQTFQSIAQQAQEDVLQRQAEFLKAQEEVAQQVAAAMPEMAAAAASPVQADAPAATARPAAGKAPARKPAADTAAAKAKTSPTAAKTGASKPAARPAAKPAARAAAAKPAASAKPAAPRKPAASRTAVKPRS
ncbi:PhaM family polyhydroxyalkanoate granule multifunctional regulatory protein [Brachymonas denitrificans]|uniref:PhaM family polyhydroxyalkanoate granule multifunctional regulatory protein n=1 Tax=Brachymonas denitrificans TaxID=28220 RepID=UPI002AFFB98E|nr:PhaM family polyhydroxyalkanoate granule multifunctional regulatory protein [Brachymonas denitrificans]